MLVILCACSNLRNVHQTEWQVLFVMVHYSPLFCLSSVKFPVHVDLAPCLIPSRCVIIICVLYTFEMRIVVTRLDDSGP